MKPAKLLLTTLIITFALSLVPLHVALCADADTGEIADIESVDYADSDGFEELDAASENEAFDAASEDEMAVLSMGAGAIEAGSVGKAQLLSPLLSESFQTDLATGAATVSVPIAVPPGRKNMQPQLALSYSSNNQNGICGVGWGLTTSSIQRSTKRGTPTYDNALDTFVFSSSGSSGELIPLTGQQGEYRQKIETVFMKYTYDGSTWTVRDKNGTKYTFGGVSTSRIVDPGDSSRIFAWFLDSVEDLHGNTVAFTYVKDTSQVYLDKVNYTGNTSQGLSADKAVEFIYDETGRTDIIYNNRSGWEIATKWLLDKVRINVDNGLKWMYVLDYTQSDDTQRSLLTNITLYDGEPGNLNTKHLPPKVFTYQKID
ncbi:MAG: hypothetical protein NG740_02685 [Omnitrophica bacterium]|nr:hypothetical protein [Candidatus Omnitrophota bacterium]